MDKKLLSERDICTKYITPALEKSGWDKLRNIISSVKSKYQQNQMLLQQVLRGAGGVRGNY